MSEGLLCFLAGLAAPFVVPFYAIKGKYPEWLITPDDLHSPFGQYEPTVRSIYERFGRYIGDVYWLGLRNRAYGLRYKYKPAGLKGLKTYDHLLIARTGEGEVSMVLDDNLYVEKTRAFGPLQVISGWRLTPILNTKLNKDPVRLINMDGRPVFSIRKK